MENRKGKKIHIRKLLGFSQRTSFGIVNAMKNQKENIHILFFLKKWLVFTEENVVAILRQRKTKRQKKFILKSGWFLPKKIFWHTYRIKN
jgi:hypothetical protein